MMNKDTLYLSLFLSISRSPSVFLFRLGGSFFPGGKSTVPRHHVGIHLSWGNWLGKTFGAKTSQMLIRYDLMRIRE